MFPSLGLSSSYNSELLQNMSNSGEHLGCVKDQRGPVCPYMKPRSSQIDFQSRYITVQNQKLLRLSHNCVIYTVSENQLRVKEKPLTFRNSGDEAFISKESIVLIPFLLNFQF